MNGKKRCAWSESNSLLLTYHDLEWGVPQHDDRQLFEMLNLEGAQAGLSWLTILKRRESYRIAFDNFDARKIISYDAAKQAELLVDVGIIRNRLKIAAVRSNAEALLTIIERKSSFDAYVWAFVADKHLTYSDHNEAVRGSEVMSQMLKKDGFRFVGPTICYAFMQAVGMINDHSLECYRYAEIERVSL
jgi:DNA-3-methyladenine glycosylase I